MYAEKNVVKVNGIEVDGEFADAIVEAIAMKDFPYTVQIHKSRHYEAEAWCREHLGPRWSVTENRNGIWCCFWAGRENFGYYNYHFGNERDMIIFSLKWQ
jgi:hypothetical protein